MAAKTYLILTPPAKGADDVDARFIRDGFSWAGFAVPVLFLLWHRLWLAAALALVMQVAAFGAIVAGYGPAGSCLLIAVGMITALEGPVLSASSLRARGWQERPVVYADDLATAEAIHYADIGESEDRTVTPRPGAPMTGRTAASGSVPGFGLAGFYGER